MTLGYQASYSETSCDLFFFRFSRDVTEAMLVSLNNRTAAMLVSPTNPPRIERYYHAIVFFCFGGKTRSSSGFFFLEIRPTDPISGNAFDDKRKKKGGGGFFLKSDRPTQYQETHSTINEKKGGVGGGERWTFY